MDRYLISKRKTGETIQVESRESESDSDVPRKLQKAEPSSSKAKTKPARQYDDSYIEFGFINNDGLPQCVLCSVCLSKDSMKPSNLKRHLKTNHPSFSDKPREFFERKQDELSKQKAVVKKAATVMPNILRASYLVSLRIARAKKPHTIGETLILPCAVDMAETVLGAEAAKKLKTIPLSNNTVSRRISDLSQDIKDQLYSRLRNCPCFALQTDESTDVSGLAQLLTYVRYPSQGRIHEDMLFCRSLPTNTTG